MRDEFEQPLEQEFLHAPEQLTLQLALQLVLQEVQPEHAFWQFALQPPHPLHPPQPRQP
jgi:hypothetical protein